MFVLCSYSPTPHSPAQVGFVAGVLVATYMRFELPMKAEEKEALSPGRNIIFNDTVS